MRRDDSRGGLDYTIQKGELGEDIHHSQDEDDQNIEEDEEYDEEEDITD